MKTLASLHLAALHLPLRTAFHKATSAPWLFLQLEFTTRALSPHQRLGPQTCAPARWHMIKTILCAKMETHAHAISTHPHHNDQPTMPHANEMSLHTTQSIGPIKLLLPTTICFCLLLFNIAQILQANCLAEPRIVLHRLGNESDTTEESFALDGHPSCHSNWEMHPAPKPLHIS